MGTKTRFVICIFYVHKLLQPTYIVGTKTMSHAEFQKNRLRLQPTYIVGTKTLYNSSYLFSFQLQPMYIVGTKTAIIAVRTGFNHYNPRISWVLKLTSNVITLVALVTTTHVSRGY